MERMRKETKKLHSTNAADVSAKRQEGDAAERTADKENREHKDSVFVDLFYEDETAENNLLSLYNALHGTDYRSRSMIRKIRVGNVLYKNFKNDISFEVGEKLIVFGEHQSTINQNMPLRCLMYVGRAYEQLVDQRARYRDALVRIPTPEFYTFYNGVKEYPLERELFLSDAFLDPTDKNPLEQTVKVININFQKAHDILDKCEVLKEYSQFVNTVRKYAKEEDSIRKAIYECMEQGILADYLKRKGSEVMNMLIAEYSYEEDMQVKQEEALRIGEKRGEKRGRKEGKKQGKKEGIFLSGKIFQMVNANPKYTDEQIAEKAACSIEEVKDVRKMFSI